MDTNQTPTTAEQTLLEIATFIADDAQLDWLMDHFASCGEAYPSKLALCLDLLSDAIGAAYDNHTESADEILHGELA